MFQAKGTMEDIKAYKPEKNSIGSGQVLSCGYEKEKAKILVKEMVESLALSLVDKDLVTNKVVLTIGYEAILFFSGLYALISSIVQGSYPHA